MSEEDQIMEATSRMSAATPRMTAAAPMLKVGTVASTPREALSGVALKRMAVQGGFAVDDATGDRMIQSLEGVIDSLAARWRELEKLQESPPMSSTATARWVSTHMQQTANDERGLLTQLQQARDEFPTYVEAINLAKKNYLEQDEKVRASMSQFKTLS
ncbi:hypothetical protein [Amycolatopsis sp.]|jgi:hypothetical protein|uniref:hypothetical protein n=1 Tax=Amycolatopsis sp. TaxID=37632 RepID=UPI002E0855DE|nr:hypothetical protein [Amycolatopsis sp.]